MVSSTEQQSTARRIVQEARTVAVLGMKGDDQAEAAAHQVPKYLELHGYEILPVNPHLVDIGYPGAVSRLGELEESPDLVLVFRRAATLSQHVDELIALNPGGVWFQVGIRDDAVARRLEEAGIPVVQDTCMYQVHRQGSRRRGGAGAVTR